jgi:transposase InsO family protein
MGRPLSGTLSSFHPAIVKQLEEWRTEYEYWGPKILHVELKKCVRFEGLAIPSRSIIAQLLKENGYIKKAYVKRATTNDVDKLPKVAQAHQRWQIDGKGNEQLPGLGYFSFINVKDVYTNIVSCILPAWKSSLNGSPSAEDYKLALRLGFCEHGLPQQIQTDHAGVFYDNQNESSFPTLFHLWLIGLGVDLVYSRVRKPTDQAKVERQHQTSLWQVWRKSGYKNWQVLFELCQQRRHRLNFDIPCATLNNRSPMKAFPQQYHSGRIYRPEIEHQIFDLLKVDHYLAERSWKRKVAKNQAIKIAKQSYSLGKAKVGQIITVKFDPFLRHFKFCNDEGDFLDSRPAKGLDEQRILGNLDITLPPNFQLQIPFEYEQEARLRLYETPLVTS